MPTARPTEVSDMDRIPAIGSPLPALPSRAPAIRESDSSAFAALISPAEPEHAAPLLDALNGGDPATQQQRIAHFTSHVSAECFISLLQTMDPMPYDHRARAEYKRHYAQLRDALTVPPPPRDAGPVDPLK